MPLDPAARCPLEIQKLQASRFANINQSLVFFSGDNARAMGRHYDSQALTMSPNLHTPAIDHDSAGLRGRRVGQITKAKRELSAPGCPLNELRL